MNDHDHTPWDVYARNDRAHDYLERLAERRAQRFEKRLQLTIIVFAGILYAYLFALLLVYFVL
jgi:hypothetical protein